MYSAAVESILEHSMVLVRAWLMAATMADATDCEKAGLSADLKAVWMAAEKDLQSAATTAALRESVLAGSMAGRSAV